jgi:hypothetical protein
MTSTSLQPQQRPQQPPSLIRSLGGATAHGWRRWACLVHHPLQGVTAELIQPPITDAHTSAAAALLAPEGMQDCMAAVTQSSTPVFNCLPCGPTQHTTAAAAAQDTDPLQHANKEPNKSAGGPAAWPTTPRSLHTSHQPPCTASCGAGPFIAEGGEGHLSARRPMQGCPCQQPCS